VPQVRTTYLPGAMSWRGVAHTGGLTPPMRARRRQARPPDVRITSRVACQPRRGERHCSRDRQHGSRGRMHHSWIENAGLAGAMQDQRGAMQGSQGGLQGSRGAMQASRGATQGLQGDMQGRRGAMQPRGVQGRARRVRCRARLVRRRPRGGNAGLAG
jgi:hypothetical protein